MFIQEKEDTAGNVRSVNKLVDRCDYCSEEIDWEFEERYPHIFMDDSLCLCAVVKELKMMEGEFKAYRDRVKESLDAFEDFAHGHDKDLDMCIDLLREFNGFVPKHPDKIKQLKKKWKVLS